jgi:malate dehydrogenase
MIDVAIVGAGELGGSLAHVLARREIVRRIQLIDPAGQIAAGKALDIMQAGPIEGFSTPVHGGTDISRVAGAQVVLLADAAHQADTTDALFGLRQIAQLAARAIVVCARAEACDLVDRGVRELGFNRLRLLGSAPEAVSAALRALIALQVDGSVREVDVAVTGKPPDHLVVDWQTTSAGGSALTDLLPDTALRKLVSQTPALWPPGPHALAHAGAEAVAAIGGVSRRRLSCFVAPDDTSGRRWRTVAMPVKLGAQGIVRVDEPTLGAGARVALENARRL